MSSKLLKRHKIDHDMGRFIKKYRRLNYDAGVSLKAAMLRHTDKININN